jgi:predicted ArsR family transcriptional regulator
MMSTTSRWTFVTNHGAVLALIGEHGQITAREIAQAAGITERAVRKIIADLEAEGYIDKTRVGRANVYRVNVHLPLRREDRRDVAVGELLTALSSASGLSEGKNDETSPPP